MEKLVVTYTEGDGYTWSAEATVPLEYESPEQFLCDFADKLAEISNSLELGFTFKLAGAVFDATNFIIDGKIYLPTVETLNEWFEHNRPKI